MLRLFRIMIALLVVSAAVITLVIATHYADSMWNCASFLNMEGIASIFDLTSGAYFIDHHTRAPTTNLSLVGFRDVLTYDYLSPSNVHRIGVVTGYDPSSAPYLDFAESPTFFARREQESLTRNYLPIMTYDQTTRTQTMTIYALRTLAPLVSSVHTDVTLAKSPSGNYERLPVAWSLDEQWFAYLNPTATGVTVTLLSPAQNHVRSFPLTGSYEDTSFVWSISNRALAVSSSHNYFAELFVAADDAWSSVETYHLRTNDPNAPLGLSYWSLDDRAFYFLRPSVALGNSSPNRLFVYHLDTKLTELAEDERVNRLGLRLGNRWSCQYHGTGGTLTSVTNAYSPIVLADFGLSDGACAPIMQSPDGTRVVVPSRPTPTADVVWLGLTADPFTITPLSLPATTHQLLAWSPDSRFVVFFVPDVQTNDPNDGQLGILDVAIWRWVLVDEPIAVDQFVSAELPRIISPDSTRLLTLSADRQSLLIVSTDGQVINRLPVAATYPYLTVNWSPDSATLLLTDTHSSSLPTFRTYTRAGQPLTTLTSPRAFARWNSDDALHGWTHCQPSLAFPRLHLPT